MCPTHGLFGDNYGISTKFRTWAGPRVDEKKPGDYVDFVDEVVYSGNELDVLRAIDCPMTIGQHEAGLYVYREGFLLFEFGDFKYKVEE